MIKTGILGGAFDPIHKGHIGLAEAALKKYCLDRIVFVPSNNPPHKKPHSADGFHRLNMINLVCSELGSKFLSSNIELLIEGFSYTYNTLKKWHEVNPDDDIYFITGSDIFASIESWYKYEEILCLAKFIVAERVGFSLNKALSCIKTRYVNSLIGNKIFFFNSNIADISSSMLREGNIKNINFIPESVREYINEHKLYEGE